MKTAKSIYLYFLPFLFMFAISCGEQQEETESTEADTTSGKEESVVSEEKPQQDTAAKTILFFGNSITAGMGLEPEEAFPAVIQRKIDSLGLNYEVVNAGLSGETTASGRNRVGWVLNQNVDIFVLELGANDGLRGVPLDETRRNLQAIIDTVQNNNPETEIILAGMQLPPNIGEEYTSEFKNLFPELAEKNDIHLIPFLLEEVGGNPELNQGDGIHPTAEGQKIVAENVWDVLSEVMEEQNTDEAGS